MGQSVLTVALPSRVLTSSRLLSAGRSDLRLLSGDAFSVIDNSLRRNIRLDFPVSDLKSRNCNFTIPVSDLKSRNCNFTIPVSDLKSRNCNFTIHVFDLKSSNCNFTIHVFGHPRSSITLSTHSPRPPSRFLPEVSPDVRASRSTGVRSGAPTSTFRPQI